MSKRSYGEAEMIGALKQLEPGRMAADIRRCDVYCWIVSSDTNSAM